MPIPTRASWSAPAQFDAAHARLRVVEVGVMTTFPSSDESFARLHALLAVAVGTLLAWRFWPRRK
jgi:hypothetical protein